MVGTSNLGSWVMAIDLRMDPNHQTLGGMAHGGGGFVPDAARKTRKSRCVHYRALKISVRSTHVNTNST